MTLKESEKIDLNGSSITHCMLNWPLLYCGSTAAARAITMVVSMSQPIVTLIIPSHSLIEPSGKIIASHCECFSVSHTAVAHNNNNNWRENG